MTASAAPRSLRILYLALDLDVANSTGESTHVIHVVRAMQHLGHDLTLVLPDTNANRGGACDLEKTGLRFLFVPNGSTWRQLWRLLRLIGSRPFDVIYERRFSPKVAAILGRLRGVPFVVEINAIAPIDAEIYSGKSAKASRLRSTWHSLLLRRASAIVVVTDALASRLREDYSVSPHRIEVVPNAADSDLFRPLDPIECRRRLGVPEGFPVACFVGDFAPWYSLDTVLQAIARLRDAGNPFRVLFVGDGMRAGTLRQMARDLRLDELVYWYGRRPHNDVPLYVGASDLALAPTAPIERNTKSGSSSLKVFEYLACARPVVTTDVFAVSQPELRPVLVLVPPGDPLALADAMLRLIANPEERRRLGRIGRQLVEERYSWTAVAQRLSGLLETVANPERRN